jgi:hypothetical protein
MMSSAVRDIIFSALANNPELRETANSDRLVRYVQVSEKNNGKTRNTKYDSITRIARIVRKEHPELRGKDWEANQSKGWKN